jgi:hypothetical protein
LVDPVAIARAVEGTAAILHLAQQGEWLSLRAGLLPI